MRGSPGALLSVIAICGGEVEDKLGPTSIRGGEWVELMHEFLLPASRCNSTSTHFEITARPVKGATASKVWLDDVSLTPM